MTISKAKAYADHIVTWLKDKTERIEIAGSIRRERPECADVDIVCIPKTEVVKDLFNVETGRKNLLSEFMETFAADPANGARIEKSGEAYQMIHLKKCQLDLWFADEKTFATRLMCRTGSKEHNIWLCDRAKAKGMKWQPYEGIYAGGQWKSGLGGTDVYVGGELVQYSSEESIYRAFSLPFIEPKDREYFHLVRKFGA